MEAKPAPAAQLKAVVLRFRDLATAPGETIKIHQQIIQEKGAVWWGWWNKSGEVPPPTVLTKLVRDAEAGGIDLFLFDSGHKQLRTARCTEITWSPNLRATPDNDCTPAYYREQHYHIWFKLSAISDQIEDPNRELQKFSYLAVDEFFASNKCQYIAFHEKRVANVDEMRQQDRTIWFLREFKDGDHTHEVSLISAHTIKPAHFPKQYVASPSRNLLWVSDLHFGDKHGFPVQTSAAEADLGQAIEAALKAANITDIAGVVISGDITWKAAEQEYESAKRFIARISTSPSSLDNYSFAISPGNHDVAFSDQPDDKTRPVTSAPEAARVNFANFYQYLFYTSPNEYMCSGRRILLGEHFPVELACLNSSLLAQSPDWFQGHGFVGEAQLQHVADQLGWKAHEGDDAPRPFRVVMLHHHLVPVVYAESPRGGSSYSVVLDAERVMQWLFRHQVDLVLHGHMHQPFFTRIVRRLHSGKDHCVHIAGLGSSGVGSDHRGGFDNTYGILTAFRRHVKLGIWSVSPGSAPSRKLHEYDIGCQN